MILFFVQREKIKYHVVILIASLLSQPVFAQLPSITSFSPVSGPVGSTVIITGTNFNTTPSGNIVYFGAVKAPVSAATATSLTVSVPAGATYQPISVTTNNLTAWSALPFIPTFPVSGPIPSNSTSFAQAVDLPTGLYPYAVVIVDLDGDGKPDLATANNANSPVSTVSVFRNTGAKGSISFAGKIDLAAPAGSTPNNIAAGDIDGDGKPDLVVANNVANTVSVYRNTSSPGNISFAPRVEFATGQIPFVCIGDLDGDGKPDLAAANYLSNTISVFKNISTPGTVSFTAKTDFITPNTPKYISVGDIDGDGRLDLVTANQLSSSVSIFMNNSTTGNISFQTHVDISTGGYPYSVAIGDLDGDGKPELAVANQFYQSVEVLRNGSTAGNISFYPKTELSTGAETYQVAIGDIDGDGKPDLVAATQLAVYTFRNNCSTGTISFINPWTYYNYFPNFIAIGDLDGDGKPDLAATNTITSAVSIFRNRFTEPDVASFSPTTAGAGAAVTITGDHFTGANAVNFGGIPAASFIIQTDSSITAVVGAGVSGSVSVTTPAGKDSLGGFVFAGPPVINSFTPDTGVFRTAITITGYNFTGCTGVSFGGKPALSFTVTSPGTITAVVGSGASGDLTLTTPYGTATRTGFTFISAPTVTNFSPDSAGNGTTVTITGTNFTTATAVLFGPLPAASFTVVSGNSITATVAGGSTGNVTVTTKGGSASLPGFTFLTGPPPLITSFSPASGQPGTSVVISGNNFNTIPANNIVFFGVVRATVTAASATSLTVTVPVVATYGPITVLNMGYGLIAYSSGYFVVTSAKTGPIDTTSFAPKIDITGFNVRQIVLGDFDGDGKLDIAGESLYNTVSVQRNTSTPGNLSFDPVKDFPIISSNGGGGSGIGFIAVADIDGDGKLDIIALNTIANDIGSVSVLRNTSTPGNVSFADQVIFTSVVNVNNLVVADFDGDGRADIIVEGQSATSILISNSSVGVISFLPQQNLSIRGGISVWGDFNKDGKTDILATGPAISILKNTSAGGVFSFETDPILYPEYDHYPQNASIGDLDGDGYQDLFFVNSGADNGYYTTSRNTGSAGAFSFTNQEYNCSPRPSRGALGDIDGDGRPDLIMLEDYGKVAVFQNTSTPGSISFGANANFLTRPNQIVMAVGDLDGDGKPDVVVNDYNITVVSILRNQTGYVPAISAASPTTFCQGGSVILTSSFAAGNQWFKDGTPIPGATSNTLTVTATARYTVTATSGGIASPYSAGIIVTVNPVPPKPTITWDAVKGMISSADSGNQWYTDTTTAIPGATGTSYKPTDERPFYLKVTQNGCSSPFSDKYQYLITATVNLPGAGNYLQIAPNPAYDFITITYRNVGISSFQARLSDLGGRTVISTVISFSGERIGLSGIAKGMYFLKVSDSNGKVITTVPVIKL